MFLRLGAILLMAACIIVPGIACGCLNSKCSPPPPTPSSCESGTIAAGGSTALQPLISNIAQDYHDVCSPATITVNENVASSEAGLRKVEAGKIDIGDSDLQSSKPDLVDHPVAVVIYVLVLNPNVQAVTNLTTSQIRGIYTGSITNWNQVGGPNVPISVVSRPTTSGTRGTFEHYILGSSETLPLDSKHVEVDTTDLVATTVASTSGAIGYIDLGTAMRQNLPTVSINGVVASSASVESGSYAFWTIEHMYTKGNPSGLTKSFLDYVIADTATITNDGYLSFNDVPSTIINAHPSPYDPNGL